MSCTESTLLGLREELVDIPVELQLADVFHGEELLGPHFSSIKDVKIELVLTKLGADLNAKFPGWEDSHINGSHQVLAMEVGVLTGDLQRLIPDERMNTKCWGELTYN